MKTINNLKNKLWGEYLVTFEKAELYYKLSNIDQSVMERCLNEIVDLLLNAQEAGQQVSNIVGSDIKKFCENLKLAYMPNWQMLKVTDGLLVCSICTFIVGLLSMFSSLIPMFAMERIHIATYFTIFLISMMGAEVISYFLRKKAFNQKESLSSRKVKLFSKMHKYLFVILVVLLGLAMPKVPIEISLFQMFFLLCTSLVIHVSALIILDHETKKEITTSFNENSTSFEEKLFESLKKKYAKVNKKRIEKGKQPLNQLQIVEKIKKEQRLCYIPQLLIFIVLVFQLLFLVWVQMRNSVEVIPMILTIILLIIIIVFISVLGRRKDFFNLITKLEKCELKLGD
ncbi:DUF1048 domain-containing protein [Alkalicella caledoniensis]|uniref:DUF1048 domain-containing protein n=1 Tax=Alkalicella caledoniensis TaxID=2731377 RepID=A0A7G9W494_ALKCA|nr:DUF1048 domain-containing protein [Alkalicella caledoniensis]QNO13506.1 DUF1048 domain-containing protein [Alkalicella caledoniensis]